MLRLGYLIHLAVTMPMLFGVLVGIAALVCVLLTICRSQSHAEMLMGKCYAWSVERERRMQTSKWKGTQLLGRRGKGLEAELGAQDTHHLKLITNWQNLGVKTPAWWIRVTKKSAFGPFLIQMEAKKQTKKNSQRCKKQGETAPLILILNQIVLAIG